MANQDDGFKPKWRHFHPQATVWVRNPLDHDVVFNVADEHNNPYQYRILEGKTTELPGGAVATLGVKAIVDELIQNDPKDVFSMWEETVRAKWESTIILRVKEAPTLTTANKVSGEVTLPVVEDESFDDETDQIETEAPVYPTKVDEVDDIESGEAVASVASASLPAEDIEIED